MTKFVIESHFRLQEWVAEEKGYFRAEGLDYEFHELIRSSGGAHHAASGKTGAFQSIEKGRAANVTCACHWTVNVAASRGHTRLFADVHGWASLFVAVLFMGGVQLVSLGIIGEYLGRIYTEVKRRPLYVVQERLGFADQSKTTPGTLRAIANRD